MNPERDPALLTHQMRQAHLALVANVEKHHGIKIVPAQMARDPWKQARLWRQSRTTAEVEQACRSLSYRGMPWLSHVLESVGPQKTGPWLTSALPGLGWHQWGEAVDYFVLNPDGSADWNGDHRGYLVLAEEAARLGLTAGYFWHRRDPGHVQMYRQEIPQIHSGPEIDSLMKQRWAHLESSA